VTGADAGAVLELSLREAMQLGQDHIGAEHILLGLVREGDGVAAPVLVKLGAELNQVRQQVIQLVQGRAGEDVTGAGSGLGKRARAQLPDVTLTRASTSTSRAAMARRSPESDRRPGNVRLSRVEAAAFGGEAEEGYGLAEGLPNRSAS